MGGESSMSKIETIAKKKGKGPGES